MMRRSVVHDVSSVLEWASDHLKPDPFGAVHFESALPDYSQWCRKRCRPVQSRGLFRYQMGQLGYIGTVFHGVQLNYPTEREMTIIDKLATAGAQYGVSPRDSDVIAWAYERTELGPYYRLPITEAWEDYAAWCTRNGVAGGTRQYLGRLMTKRGVARTRLDERVCLVGLRLIPPAPTSSTDEL